MRDPRTPGSGQATALHLYSTPGLGPAYLEQLLNSGVVLATDERQILDWVAKGQYPLAISASDLLAAEMRSKGLPIELMRGDALQEGSYLTPGFGAVAVVNRAPHPSAASVYLNFLLSQEGQTEWTRASGYASRRADTPVDHLPEFLVPKPGVELQPNYKEPYVRMREEMDAFLRAIVR